MSAGKAKCRHPGCDFWCVYTSGQDWARKMDEHYEEQHPGKRESGLKEFTNVRCPFCRQREFTAPSAKIAHALLDEHIAERHAEEQKRETVPWTEADLQLLRGMRISPL